MQARYGRFRLRMKESGRAGEVGKAVARYGIARIGFGTAGMDRSSGVGSSWPWTGMVRWGSLRLLRALNPLYPAYGDGLFLGLGGMIFREMVGSSQFNRGRYQHLGPFQGVLGRHPVGH